MGKALPGQKHVAPTSGGPVFAVTCPFCGQANDMRELQNSQLLDTGHEVECDKCHYLAVVVSIQTVTYVTVRPSNKHPSRATAGDAPPQQARTLSPAATARLLGHAPQRRGRR